MEERYPTERAKKALEARSRFLCAVRKGFPDVSKPQVGRRGRLLVHQYRYGSEAAWDAVALPLIRPLDIGALTLTASTDA